MKSINWKDVAARTVKTFVAVFLGSLSVNVDLQGVDSKVLARVLFATLLSAVSAGITAVWNLLLEIFRDQINAGIDKIFGRLPDGITAVWNLLLEIFRDQINAGIDKIFGRLPDGTQDEVFTVEDVEQDEEPEPTIGDGLK